MNCSDCQELKFGGSCRCGECVRRQDTAVEKFLNGEASAHSVIREFGVDCSKHPTRASSMENALIDARSDILNLRRPIDLVGEVTRLREALTVIAEG